MQLLQAEEGHNGDVGRAGDEKKFQNVGGVVEEDSYIKAMATADESIKRLTKQATSKLSCSMVEDGDLGCSRST